MTENWEDLIMGCTAGDRHCQHEVYKRSWSSIFPAVLRVIRNRNEAEDVMQDSIIKGFERLSELKSPGAYPAWQKKISVRAALNHIRNRIKFDDEVQLVNESDGSEMEELVTDIEPIKILKAMDELPEGYRLVVNMYLVEELTHEEIGNALGIATATSRSQYSRALKKLRNSLLEKHEQQV